jgi:glycerol-3-phosphate dehydrogenase (NAD(P)+)
MDKKKVSVVGAGAWGTTLAGMMADKGFQTVLWVHDDQLAREIRTKKENQIYLPGYKIPSGLKVTADLIEAVAEADLIILAVASQFLKTTIRDLGRISLGSRVFFLSAIKGLDHDTFFRPSQIIRNFLPEKYRGLVGVLSGPNLAREISAGLPAAAVVAAESLDVAEEIRSYLMSEKFRVYTNTDMIGVELGGALKNVIAIAAGILEGLKLGDNSKAALLVRGIMEIARLGKKLGARAETFSGLSGIGDMATTCYSSLSRNHQVGLELAKGKTLEAILKKMKAVAEGVNTAKAARMLAEKNEVEMPITEQVYLTLFEGKSPQKAIIDLMVREPKYETS